MLRQTEKVEKRILEAELQKYKENVKLINNPAVITEGFHKLFGFNRSYFEQFLSTHLRFSKTRRKIHISFNISGRKKHMGNQNLNFKSPPSAASKDNYETIFNQMLERKSSHKSNGPKNIILNTSKRNKIEPKKYSSVSVDRKIDETRKIDILFFGKKVESDDSVIFGLDRSKNETGDQANSAETVTARPGSRKIARKSAVPVNRDPDRKPLRHRSACGPCKTSEAIKINPKSLSGSFIPLRQKNSSENSKTSGLKRDRNETVSLLKETKTKPAIKTTSYTKPKPSIQDSSMFSASFANSSAKSRRLKELEDAIKERNALKRSSQSEESRRKLIEDFRNNSKKQFAPNNAQQMVNFCFDKSRSAILKSAATSMSSVATENRNKGYDIFSVEDGRDVQFLMEQNSVPKDPDLSSYNSSCSSAMEARRKDDGKVVLALEERRSNVEVDEGNGWAFSVLKRKEIGTKSDVFGRKNVNPQHLSRRKHGPLLVTRVNASNTLENIPALKDDNEERKVRNKSVSSPSH